MTTHELSKFWQDVALAYTQVALNPEREIRVGSKAEGLHAFVHFVPQFDEVHIAVSTVDENEEAVHKVSLKVVE
jgi:hypothetical protein